MFNISFKVAANKLADTLTRLHSVIPGAIEVTAIEGEGAAAPAAAPAAANGPSPKLVKVRRHKRAYRRSPDAGPTSHERAQTILRQYGVPAFKCKDFLDKCEAQGITKPVAYRALKEERSLGLLVRPEPGVYQRTPKAFSQALAS